MNFNQFDEDVSEDAPAMGEPSGGLEDMGSGTQSAPTEGGDSGNMSEEEEQDQLRQQRILSIL